jgi:hypothetical protein
MPSSCGRPKLAADLLVGSCPGTPKEWRSAAPLGMQVYLMWFSDALGLSINRLDHGVWTVGATLSSLCRRPRTPLPSDTQESPEFSGGLTKADRFLGVFLEVRDGESGKNRRTFNNLQGS